MDKEYCICGLCGGDDYTYEEMEWDIPICPKCYRNRGGWTAIKDGLPDIIEKDGCVNVVLVEWAIDIECGSQFQTANTVYVNEHPEKFIRWMYIPEE